MSSAMSVSRSLTCIKRQHAGEIRDRDAKQGRALELPQGLH